MRKVLLLVTLICLSISYAQVPANYYDSAIGLSGYTLKTELSNIITASHNPHSYNSLDSAYESTDVDHYYENDGTVFDIYSENPNGTDPYNYNFTSSDKCGNYSSEGDCYNKEHVMPQSVFGRASPMKADANSVVPTDGKVNGMRGHLPYGEVASATFTSLNGSKRGSCATAGYSGTVFEPIDEFKGDIARIMLYFATRYEDRVSGWSGSAAGAPMLDGSSDQVYDDWFIHMLVRWHNNDPVTQRELDRNDAVYNYQQNANPFINHPEWVNVIWNPVPDTVAPSTPTNLVAANVTSNTVDLTWNASTDNIMVLAYDIYQDGALIGSSSVPNYSVSGLFPVTNYSFYVIARDAEPNYSGASNTETITTITGPVYLVSEEFNDCATIPNNFTAYSEVSTNNWTCKTRYGFNNTGCYQMNGFEDDVPSKDWLITTNQIDFTRFENEKLSVYLKYKYGDMSLDLLYSTNYDGTSNPSSFTWLPMPNITINTSTGATENVQEIVDADISSISQPAYIAFKYYASSSPTRWNVDNFIIEARLRRARVDVSEKLFDNELTIYPNPTSSLLKISSVSEISKIEVYSNLGQLVASAHNTNSIDLSNLLQGFYIVKISDVTYNFALRKVFKR